MKKLAAVTLMFLGVVLGSLGFAGTAHAGDPCNPGSDQRVSADESPSYEQPSCDPTVYPPTEEPSPSNVVSPPTGTVDSGDVAANDVADEAAALPNTGGPDGMLLAGAAALLLAGGTAVVVARRRATD